MTKFKTIINQLSTKDYEIVKRNLDENNAEKSVLLLETVREENPDDDFLMKKLKVSANAYYALRSRLNQKIEELLVQQLDNPRTDIFRKVLMINEVIFTKSKEIAIATLKKLEKELIKYDLANELTTVYKSLKKLTIHSPTHFHYSQLYNRHIAYMLALDKAEDMLAEYFKRYGDYLLTGSEASQLGLTLMKREMANVSSLYKSHRLFVYNSCIHIFHRLYVDEVEELDDETPTEDLLKENEKILSSYRTDSTYFHMNTVFDFLWLSYYDHYKVYRKVENYYNDLNLRSPQLLRNFHLFTFPSNFLILKLKRALRKNLEGELHEQNISLYDEDNIVKADVPQYYISVIYNALSAYYAHEFKSATKELTILVNDVSWKKYPNALVEARILLVFIHYIARDMEQVKLASTSIQRQIRVIGRENCQVAFAFNQLLKVAMNDMKRNKSDKVKELVGLLNIMQPSYFSPLKLVKFDEKLVRRLISSVGTHA
jgi:hypothetical protein